MIKKKTNTNWNKQFLELKISQIHEISKNCMKFIQSYRFNSEFIKKQEEIFINTNKFNLKYGIKVKY